MNTSLPTTLPGSTYLEGRGAPGAQPSAATPTDAAGAVDFASLLGGANPSPAVPATPGGVPAAVIPAGPIAAVPAGPVGPVPPPSAAGLVPPVGVLPPAAESAPVSGSGVTVTSLRPGFSPVPPPSAAGLVPPVGVLPPAAESAPVSGSGVTVTSLRPGFSPLEPTTASGAPVLVVAGEGESAPAESLDRAELEALLALVAPLAGDRWQVVASSAALPMSANAVPGDPQGPLVGVGDNSGPSGSRSREADKSGSVAIPVVSGDFSVREPEPVPGALPAAPAVGPGVARPVPTPKERASAPNWVPPPRLEVTVDPLRFGPGTIRPTTLNERPVVATSADIAPEPIFGNELLAGGAPLESAALLAIDRGQFIRPATSSVQIPTQLGSFPSSPSTLHSGQLTGISVTSGDATSPTAGIATSAGSGAEIRVLGAELELSDGTRVVFQPGSPTMPASRIGEKIAASVQAPAIAATSRMLFSEKKSQSYNNDAIKNIYNDSGISIAENLPTMPLTAALSPSSVVPIQDRTWLGVAATEAIDVRAEFSAATPVRAGEVVQAVVDVVEAQAASRLQPVPSVTVRFDLGEGALAVRVELRHGEVRTEFRTDSRELQTALAHEWRSVATTLESGVRLADPIFTTSSKSESAGFSGAGGEAFSQSRSSGRSSEEFLAAQSVRQLRGGRSAAVDDAPVALAASRHLPTSQRLSVLA